MLQSRRQVNLALQGLGAYIPRPLRIDVIVPALNEESTIGAVVAAVPRPLVHTVWVIDNGCTDATAARAQAAGAQVLAEPRRGYGNACLRGLRALPPEVGVVVFLDGDGSDVPAELPSLVAPILEGEADLVVGSRTQGGAERGSLTLPQLAGNFIASRWLSLRYGVPATDLGPFRAIRRESLAALRMESPDYGWTVEMQIKAGRHPLRYREVPVSYRRRAGGQSKISGTVRGVIGASAKILGLLLRHELRAP